MIRQPHLKWVRILQAKYLISTDNTKIVRISNLPKGSRVWNFMLNCKPLILKHLTWNIHSGGNALFWEDSWCGYLGIESLIDIEKTKENPKYIGWIRL